MERKNKVLLCSDSKWYAALLLVLEIINTQSLALTTAGSEFSTKNPNKLCSIAVGIYNCL